jgi:hypothetical protein
MSSTAECGQDRSTAPPNPLDHHITSLMMASSGPAASLLAITAFVIGGCGDDRADRDADRGSQPSSSTRSSTAPRTSSAGPDSVDGYRVVRDPLVLVQPPSASGLHPLQAIVRLNKRLPRSNEGGFGANFSVETSGLDARPEKFGTESRHCYYGTMGNEHPPASLRDPYDGKKVPFEIDIVGVRRNIRTVATLHNSSGQVTRDAVAELGCRRSR